MRYLRRHVKIACMLSKRYLEVFSTLRMDGAVNVLVQFYPGFHYMCIPAVASAEDLALVAEKPHSSRFNGASV